MSMGHKEKMKTGDELDCFSSYTKRWAGRKRGFRSYVKAKFNRRVRREVKAELRKNVDVDEFYYELDEIKERGWWTG